MKNIVRTALLGGVLVAAALGTAAPASAACYDVDLTVHDPRVCVFYSGYCDADLCIDKPL